ncbi:5'-3' exoribonuclease 2 [Striga asiatica]|uniref:5'-3' exoribonuclease 2 n=1 Tax=Striga asiatica TaxID=4170 RepID=A0A5A7QEE6_STRAF|nr:5'-3' exoribonuclease 2 [Striga asiatica]
MLCRQDPNLFPQFIPDESGPPPSSRIRASYLAELRHQPLLISFFFKNFPSPLPLLGKDDLRPKVAEDCRFPPVTPHAPFCQSTIAARLHLRTATAARRDEQQLPSVHPTPRQPSPGSHDESEFLRGRLQATEGESIQGRQIPRGPTENKQMAIRAYYWRAHSISGEFKSATARALSDDLFSEPRRGRTIHCDTSSIAAEQVRGTTDDQNPAADEQDANNSRTPLTERNFEHHLTDRGGLGADGARLRATAGRAISESDWEQPGV